MSDIRLIKKNKNETGNVKLKVSQGGVRRLGESISSDFGKLNEYVEKRKQGGYISADEIKTYRETAERYTRDRDRYNRLSSRPNGIIGNVVNNQAEKDHASWLSSITEDMDASEKLFSKYKSADEYNTAVKRDDYITKYGESSFEEIKSAYNQLRADRAKAGLLEGENKELDLELSVLQDYLNFYIEAANESTMSDKLLKSPSAFDLIYSANAPFENKKMQKILLDVREHEDMINAKERSEGFDFFDAGGFSDGLQWRDLWQVPLGTAADFALSAGKGYLRLPEGLGDLAMYGASGVASGVGEVAGLFGAEGVKKGWKNAAEEIKDQAARGVVDDFFAPADETLDKYSVFGDTSNAIAEGVGQIRLLKRVPGLVALAGLGNKATSLAPLVTTFLGGMGIGIGEAYDGGATDLEAAAYGFMSGAAEAISESLFGGLGKVGDALGISRGIGGFDDKVARAVTKKIKSTLVKNGVQALIKSGGEGFEEFASGIMQAAAQKFTYMSEKDFADLVADQNLLESFTVGLLTSALAQLPSFIQSTAKGKDFVTGRTDAEQTELDTAVKEALAKAQAESESGKLSLKEKNAVRDAVLKEFELQKAIKESVTSSETIESGTETLPVGEIGEVSVGAGKAGAYEVQLTETEGEVKTVDVDSLSRNSPEYKILRAAEDSHMTPAVADAVLRGYDGSVPVSEYVAEAEYVSAAAKAGTAYEAILKGSDTLSEDVRRAIWEDGRTYSENITKARQTFLDEVKAKSEGKVMSGRFDTKEIKGMKLNRTQERAVKTAEALSSLGFNIRMVKSIGGDSRKLGYYDKRTGDIVVSVNARSKIEGVIKSQILPTMAHEITHSFRATSPELYSQYSEVVLGALYGSGELQRLVEDEFARLRDSGRFAEATDAEIYDAAYDELVAHASEDMLADPKAIEKICRENRTVGEKILDAIDRFISTLKSILSGSSEESVHEEARILRGMLKEYEAARELWVKALADSAETRAALSEAGDVVKNGEAKAEEDRQFNEALDDEYMDAVNRGDMETAQRLVDEAAKKAGYRIKGHHGTGIKFTVFDRSKTSDANDFGQGFYFSSSEIEAERYQKDDTHGDTYNKIYGVAYDNALEKIDEMGEDANDEMLFDRVFNEEFDKELARRTKDGAVISAYLRMENPFVVSGSNWITEAEAIEIARNTMYVEDVPDDIAISDWVHSIKTYAKQHDGKIDTDYFANKAGHAGQLTNALLHQGKYDGVLDYTVRDKFDSASDYHAIALNPNQIKDSSPVTYDDKGNVIPLSERFNSDNPDIRYNEALDDELTMREVLTGALEGAALTEADAKVLERYRRRVSEIDGYDERLREVNREIKEISLGKGKRDTARLSELKSEKAKLEQDLKRADRKLLELSSTEALKNLFDREAKRLRREKSEALRAATKEARRMSDAQLKEAVKRAEKRGADRERMIGAFDKAGLEIAHGIEKGKIKAKADKTEADLREKLGLARAATKEAKAKAAEDVYNERWKSAELNANRMFKKESEIAEIRRRAAERELKDRTRRERLDVEKRIRRVISYVTSQTDDKNVKQGLRGVVADFAHAILSNNAAYTQSEMTRMRERYEEIAKAGEGVEFIHRGAYDFDIFEELKKLESSLNGRAWRDLTISELGTVDRVTRNVMHMIRLENKIFRNGKGESRVKIGEACERAIAECVSRRKEKTTPKGKVGQAVQRFGDEVDRLIVTGNLMPVYYFDILGGEFEALYNDLVDGQNKWSRIVDGSTRKADEIKEKYAFNELTKGETVFTTDEGVSFEMTVREAMYFYAAFKRETLRGDTEHYLKGGIASDKIVAKAKGDDVKRYRSGTVRLSGDDVAMILDSLSTEQKAFVDELVAYLSTDIARYGNETSMDLYGIEKFGDEYYIPYRVSGDAVLKDPVEAAEPDKGKGGGEAKIKHTGMTNAIKHGAGNAMEQADIMEVFTKHCVEMANYAAFAVPIENIGGVLNFRGADGELLRAEMRQKLGDNMTRYLDTFIRDMNGGVKTTASGIEKFLSLQKKASVAASLSTIVQQPTAMFRAMAMIDPKYFVTVKGGETMKGIRASWDEMKQYAPGVTVVKDMGKFDVGSGVSAAEYISGDMTFGKAVDKAAGFAAEWADKLTWIHIWKACKAEAKAKGLRGEELLTSAGKRFTDVINRTQVYDSTLVRSENMRSRNALMKPFTAFKAEPTVTLNVMADAVRSKSPAKIARTASALLVSTIVNNALRALVYAGRDDDEEKGYLEKYGVEFSEGLVEDMMLWNYVPFVSDLASITRGFKSKRMETQLFESVYNSFNALWEDDAGWREWATFVGDVGNFAGLPVKNVIRDFVMMPMNIANSSDNSVRGAWYAAIDTLGNSTTGKNLKKIGINITNTDYDGYIEALESGDSDEAEKIFGAIIDYKMFKARRKAEAEGKKFDEDEARDSAESSVRSKVSEYLKTEASAYVDAVSKGNVKAARSALTSIVSVKKLMLKVEAEAAGEKYDEKDALKRIKSSLQSEVTSEVLSDKYDVYTENLGKGDVKAASKTAREIMEVLLSSDKYFAEATGTKYREDKSREAAESKLRSKVTEYFKKRYVAADYDTQAEIRQILRATGLYENVRSTAKAWVKASEEEDE